MPVGPQNGRAVSAPLPGLTSLTDEKAVTEDGARKAQGREACGRRRRFGRGAAVEGRQAEDAMPPRPMRAVKSPSPVKASQKAEKKESVEAPLFDPVAANKAAPAVEKVDKQRKAPITKSGRRRASSRRNCCAASRSAPARKESVASDKPSLSDANRPPKIDAPATPDDLKLISGVGPKIEGMLHSLGIFTFAQVAAWSEAERDWVDGYLNFKGRIERDDWVKQADGARQGRRRICPRLRQEAGLRRRSCFRTKTASSPTSTAASTGRWRARWRAATGTARPASSPRGATGSSTR